MRRGQPRLDSRDVQRYAEGVLQRQLDLDNYSEACTASTVYAVLLYVACRVSSVWRACRVLRGAPSDQTAYDALAATLPSRLELQRRLNAALRETLPRAVRRGKRAYPVAIDLHLVPYYGGPHPDDDQVYKGQEKASTKHHHAYATIYLCRKGQRFTLAVRAVRHDTPWQEVVRWLLRQAKRYVPAIKLVLLDRGFYSVGVIRYLQRARYPFIMPVIARGRKPDHPRGPSGSRALYCRGKSGWERYTLTQRDEKERATVDVAVRIRRKGPPRRPGSQRRAGKALVYACWGLARSRSPHWVSETYRKRFGIEASYRQLGQARGRTNSRCPRYRLLLVGLALILRNVWALAHLLVLARYRGGWPQPRLGLLPLRTLLDWIARLLEADLGVCDEIDLQRLVPS